MKTPKPPRFASPAQNLIPKAYPFFSFLRRGHIERERTKKKKFYIISNIVSSWGGLIGLVILSRWIQNFPQFIKVVSYDLNTFQKKKKIVI